MSDTDTSYSADSVPMDGECDGATVSSNDEGTSTNHGSITDESATACEKDHQTIVCMKHCLKNDKRCLKEKPNNIKGSSCQKNKAKTIDSSTCGKSNASSESTITTIETTSCPGTSDDDASVNAVDSSSGTGETDAKAIIADDSNSQDQPTSIGSHEDSDTKANGSSDWTISEDFLLRGMKQSTDELSWADIGSSLNRNKDDVKARWEAIKDRTPQHHNITADEESDCIAGRTDDRVHKAAKPSKGATVPVSRAQSADGTLSGNEASSESRHGTDEHRRQKRYLYDCVYKALYPTDVEGGENEYLAERDRAMLATIACMHTTNRLLEMKASLMNATGADVPIAVLRDWYKETWASQEDYHRLVLQQEDSAERVEKWIGGISMEEGC
ncbi:Homeodomain-like protein [Metarhizium rileyi]|uniref:Homeodomain-like protein n=1 Tax=Metarhizium rileyi (strain RCEF 4871) TaxID=1649241 RepID=A0A167KR08_METRR|nr:Homeodomain-like protein [Metarhizium rileyi RCEF 4871]